MTYFNINNASFYSASSTSGEFDAYPSQTSAIEQENLEVSETPINGWGMGSQPGYMVSEPTGLRAEANFGEYDYNPMAITVLRLLVSRVCAFDADPRSRSIVISGALLARSWS